jgi:DNA primase
MQNLEEIRQRVSLTALAEAAGAEFDSRLRSVCPLPGHQGDRSSRAFSVYDNGRRWKCHSSCPPDASGGDVIAFYMAWKEVDFKTAIQELGGDAPERATSAPASVSLSLSTPQPPTQAWSERAGQFITWAEANLDKHPGAMTYLENERGLSPETIRTFRLGYNPDNLYDNPTRWGLDGKKIWLPRGIVIPGFSGGQPWYVKIRRPLAGDELGEHIGAWTARDGLADVKFGGPRGGVSCLFRLELLGHLPVLFLVEGEWDAMLVWEYAPDLCDVATLGGAGAKLDLLDLSLLTRYAAIIAVYDNDAAGDKGRVYITELQKKIPRIRVVHPPAHDLTDFWKSGGAPSIHSPVPAVPAQAGQVLRPWLAGQVSTALNDAFGDIGLPQQWAGLARFVAQELHQAQPDFS